MEKELFLSTLKSKSQVDNLSDRTFDEVATLWLPQFSDDSKITDESWNLPVQMLKTMSGQLRHDISVGIAVGKSQWENDATTAKQKAIDEALARAKEEWEKGSKPHQETDTPPSVGDIDKKIADAITTAITELAGENGALGKLTKQHSDLLAALAAKEKALTEADVRTQIRNHLIARGVEEDDYALEITMEKLTIGDNPDVAALSAKAEKDYEAIYKRMHKSDGAQPFAGGAGSGTPDGGTGAAAWIQSRANLAEQAATAAEERKKLLK